MAGVHQMMMGRKISGTAQITNQVISVSDEGTAVAGYQVNTDGTITDNVDVFLETWLLTGTSDEFDVRATHIGGSAPIGTLNTWLNLGTFSRTWSVLQSSPGTKTCFLTIEIGLAGSGTALDSANVDLSATAT